MLTDAEIDGMRSTSETAMPDIGTVSRESNTGSLDATSGTWSPASPTVIYSGRLRVRPSSGSERDVDFGDIDTTIRRYVATIPVGASVIKVGDHLVVSSSADTHIVGVPMGVAAVSVGSWQIDCRILVEVVE